MVVELVIQIILYLIVFLSFWPVGLLLAWLCRDEIIYRKWFNYILLSFFIVLALLVLFFRYFPAIFAVVYMIFITLVSIIKSRDKKFIKN